LKGAASEVAENSTLSLLLGGAALQRCGKRFILIASLGAEVALFAAEGFFPQPLQTCRNRRDIDSGF
jgi:hypothetical protein